MKVLDAIAWWIPFLLGALVGSLSIVALLVLPLRGWDVS